MTKKNNLSNLVLSAMFLAIAYIIPFLTGQIPQIGKMLCPMHIPVILCGFVCGAPWGLIIGFVAPLLRSLTIGIPVFYPTAFSMAFELAAYGFISGMLYRVFPKKKCYIYLSLIISMVIGRLIWGTVQFICMGLDSSEFGFAAFWAAAVSNALPGIILQIILIPVAVMLFENTKLIRTQKT